MIRLFYKFVYVLKHALLQMKRHFLLCLSAISAVFISLTLITIFVIAGLHVDHFASNIESGVRIHVVLQNHIVTEEDINAVEQDIKAIKNVDKAIFSDKDAELELMIQEKGKAFELYRGENNPLANAYFVTVKDGTIIDTTAKEIEALAGVQSVAYGGSTVKELMEMLQKARLIGYGISGLLMFLCLYLIYNTIKSTIYSQREEIKIMAQVGATRRFIRIPFEIEGIFIGLVGALAPFAMVKWGYPYVYNAVGGSLFTRLLSLIKPDVLINQIGWYILILGAILGFVASFLAVARHLYKTR
ncbi:MAG: ABC transporter permease [Holdemanella sp.]|nr:ABC transporter permease [Holdemanella sp.]